MVHWFYYDIGLGLFFKKEKKWPSILPLESIGLKVIFKEGKNCKRKKCKHWFIPDGIRLYNFEWKENKRKVTLYTTAVQILLFRLRPSLVRYWIIICCNNKIKNKIRPFLTYIVLILAWFLSKWKSLLFQDPSILPNIFTELLASPIFSKLFITKIELRRKNFRTKLYYDTKPRLALRFRSNSENF